MKMITQGKKNVKKNTNKSETVKSHIIYGLPVNDKRLLLY